MSEVGQPRVLVLPYASESPETDILAEAASENLWRTLGRIRGISIVQRAAALKLEGVEPTQQQLAELGAFTHILGGSVSERGGGFVIDSELRRVDGTRQQTVWQDQSASEASVFFERLNRQKADLVSALNIALNAREREILEAVHTTDAAAYVDSAKVRALLLDNGGWTDIQHAMAFFENARHQDPEFVDTMAGYAQVNFIAWVNGWNNVRDNRDALRDALETADQILALSPTHPTALSIKILVMAHQLRQEEALELARGAVFRNNHAPVLRRTLAFAFMVNGQYDEARAALARYVELAARPTSYDNGLLLWYYLRLDDLNAAAAVIEEMEANGQNTSGQFASVSEFLVRVGSTEEAKSVTSGVLFVVPFLSLSWFDPMYRVFRDPAVFENFSDAMTKAGYPKHPFGFDKSHAEDRLTHAELTELLSGGITAIDVTDPLGEPADFEVYADGSMMMHYNFLPTRPFQGTWKIEGDTVCLSVPGIVLGHKYCDGFYRDSTRWRDDAPRYIQLNAFGLFRFGVEQKAE